MARFRMDDLKSIEYAPTSPATLRSKIGEVILSSRGRWVDGLVGPRRPAGMQAGCCQHVRNLRQRLDRTAVAT